VNDAGSAARIETIERGYEFLLAYAAQGRQDDRGSEARATLTAMFDALDGLAAALRAPFAGVPGAADFLDAVVRDAAAARGAIAIVLSRESIASLLVDNLNANVHLRALLTDLFLLEQAGRASARHPS
jgi:nitrogen-specific signal transduction histidine kinase